MMSKLPAADTNSSQRWHSAYPLVAPLGLIVIGASAFNILPLLAQGAAHTLGFSGRQIGVMSFALSLGAGASALFAGLWVRSVPWPRAARVALGGMLACNALALLAQSYGVFVLVQGLAGFFGGSVLSLAGTVLSDRPEAARSFGIANAMQAAYQVTALLAGPALLQWAGLDGVLIMLATLSGLGMLLAARLPVKGRPVASTHVSRALLKPATLLGIAGIAVYFVNAGAYWTYIGLIGQAHGLTSRVVANGIAAGVSAGIVGGLLAWGLGDRWGRLWPLSLAAGLTGGAALLLQSSFSAGTFVLSALMYFLAWNYSLAYQMTLISQVDATGRGVAISGAFGYLGQAAGAAVAALWVTPEDYRAVNWVVVAAVCVSTLLFALSSRVHRNAASKALKDCLPSTSSLTG